MSLSQDHIDEALSKIDDGLELHVRARRAWWQLRGRAAIRFREEIERARKIVEALSERFRIRRPPTTTILTTEPIDVAELPDVVLDREWLTCADICDASGMSDRAVRGYLRKHDVSFRKARLDRLMKVYHAEDVALVLETDWAMNVDIQLSRKPYVLAPQAVTLHEEWYSFIELAHALGRSKGSVQQAIYSSDVSLTSDRWRQSGHGRKTRFFRANEALVRLLEAHFDVAIQLRTGVREAA